MNRQGRVLVVDDLVRWREQLVETLQRAGFYADSASTIAEVLRRLDKAFYHVLVLDIRLVEADTNNEEGISLLRELDRRGLSEASKVIILSAYGTQERMRLAFKGHKVSDFLSKDEFSSRVFLESIHQAFSEKEAAINLSLDVHWQQGSDPEQIIAHLDIEGMPLKWDKALRNRLVLELDDLLCRLFSQTNRILVKPLISGRSGVGVLRVQPFYDNKGIGQEVIVKFGDPRKIEEEYRNFKEHVEPFVGSGRSTAIRNARRTAHLQGITYTFLGTGSHQLVDFADFYRRVDESQITDALDQLFRQTCGTWYANRRLELLDLRADYQRLLGSTLTELDQIRSRQLKSVRGKQELRFASLSEQRTFTNPLLMKAGPSLARTTYTCMTHGDFNPHNLLVDDTGHIWLIDFQGTGHSHILRDVAMIDSAIRFQILAENDAALEERYYLEKELLNGIQHFSQVQLLATNISTANRALVKAYSTVAHLRRLAYLLLVQNQDQRGAINDDISEYYIALFYTALNTLQFSSLSSTQREHALLSASLLADRLGFGSK